MNQSFDDFDRAIVMALQSDGRLTNQELADQIHLSPSQCSRRRAALERAGVIEGYSARLDREKTGHELLVFISVMLEHHDAKIAAEFAELLARSPEILEAHAMTGEMDYLVKVAVRNLAELQRFINGVLLPHRAVRQVHSSIALTSLKENAPLNVN